jgi:hypothetical protein
MVSIGIDGSKIRTFGPKSGGLPLDGPPHSGVTVQLGMHWTVLPLLEDDEPALLLEGAPPAPLLLEEDAPPPVLPLLEDDMEEPVPRDTVHPDHASASSAASRMTVVGRSP